MDAVLAKVDAAVTQATIDPTTADNIKSWLVNSQVSQFHDAIRALIRQADWLTLQDAFYTQIEFGTAGIRGRTGLGSARINSWTIGMAAQGLANYINKQGDKAKKRGVAIGADTRLTSPEFVQLAADILTANGIGVFRFVQPPQVGMFSFAIRRYKTQAGIYISASHNPPADNGVKIYWEDGGQVLPPHDQAISQAIKQVTSYKNTPANLDLVTEIGDAFDTAYRTRVLQESVSHSRSAKIVFSPFHGTGQYGVLPILREAGFEVITVDEQMEPDGNFPNIPGGVPNPENQEANSLTAQKVTETQADIGISTDPDADRVGIIIPAATPMPPIQAAAAGLPLTGGRLSGRPRAETVILSGNQTVSLLAYFIADRLRANNQLPKNGFMLRNITTTAIVDAIAEDFGLKIYNTSPVGFKYFGGLITAHEDFGDEIYVYGGEESFGSLKGSYARDKDASSAALLAAEMVSWLKDNGRTVHDLLDELYRRYGYYHNDVISIVYEGAAGFAKMQQLMAKLRNNSPKQIGEWPVHSVIDRSTNEIKGANGRLIGKVEDYPTNALIFHLTEGGQNQVVVRPSGTEPKVKIYVAMYNPAAREASNVGPIIAETKQKAEALKEGLKLLAAQLTK